MAMLLFADMNLVQVNNINRKLKHLFFQQKAHTHIYTKAQNVEIESLSKSKDLNLE